MCWVRGGRLAVGAAAVPGDGAQEGGGRLAAVCAWVGGGGRTDVCMGEGAVATAAAEFGA